jgi:putative thioredoxin
MERMSMEPIIGGGAANQADVVKETDTANFAKDVVEASMEVPVIVDFWAPWCGPCKQLGPMLEKVVKAANGAVRMVKINVDENQPLAQQLRVQSIPAVYAFKGGQPVDGFVGAVPESQIRTFVERLAGEVGPSPVDQALEQAAQAFEGGDLAAAAQIYGQVLQAEAGNPTALGGLARVYVENGDLDHAEQVLATVPPDHMNHADVAGARAALALAQQAGDGADTAALRQAVEANPNDHQSRLDLAVALAQAGDREGAADQLLEVIGRDRAWNDDAARKQLLQLFEAWGPTDPLTVDTRRRLSSLLFS